MAKPPIPWHRPCLFSAVGALGGIELRSQRVLFILILLFMCLAACQSGGSKQSSSKHPTQSSSGSTQAVKTGQSSGGQVASSQNTTSSGGVSGLPAVPLESTASGASSISLPASVPSVPSVVKQVSPSIVQIISQGVREGNQRGTAAGSGFAFDNQGHILTNNHVVEGASKITVVTSGNDILPAKLVGRDPTSDVAVLQVNKKLPPLRLGSTDDVSVGQTVIAIGNALALPEGPTVTTGVISALNRSQAEPGTSPSNPGTTLYSLIQTDTAINPGNSGGPLLTLDGKVIGINTLGQRQTASGEPVQGINFAVSIDTAKSVADEIIRTGKVVYPFIGIVNPQFLYPEIAVRHNIPYVPGIYIGGIVRNSPADEAHLTCSDVITALNGQKIRNESTFTELLRQHEPGETITLTVLRGKQQKQIQVQLARRPTSTSGSSVYCPK